MSLGLTVESLPGTVPPVAYQWNAETRILTARFAVPAATGFTGAVEVTGDDGAIVVLDAAGGLLTGVEIVVWPGAEVHRRLRPPEAPPGRVRIPGAPAASGVGAHEVETAIDADVTPARDVLHVLIGDQEPARTVRVADHVVVELSAEGGMAGFWLDRVPPAPGAAA